MDDRRAEAQGDSGRLAALLALVALLPFLRGLLSGHAFFFRDLSGHFFPLRLFAASGLRAGELRYWNPFAHEGTPLALPPLGYPLDLLQALWPSEVGLSLLLALHVPLAALTMFALGRQLGLSGLAAAGGAVVYALGGFTLSSLNLYVYLQAIAWAPLVIFTLRRAAAGAWRQVPAAAAAAGLLLSTTGIEIAAQAFLAGLLLSWPRNPRAALRLGASLGLGFGMAGGVLLPMSALVAGSARESGFPVEVALAHSVHPISLLQGLVAGLYADPARFTETFWGQNFFPRGFPYFLSLYLGALAIGLALVGAGQRSLVARLFVGLTLAGLVVSLGTYAGLSPLVDEFAWLRRVRFPSKAYFLVQLGVAGLCGLALNEAGAAGHERQARRLGAGLATLSGLVLLGTAALDFASGTRDFLLLGFFPPEMGWASRVAAAASILRDARIGALVALGAGLVFLAAGRGLVSLRRATALAVALLGADLLRGGAGLNPMVSPDFYRPSVEAEQLARVVKAAGGRLFTFDPGYSPAYYAARATRRDHEVWSFAVLQETLAPSHNLGLQVPSALSPDQTMLVPESRVLRPDEAAPSAWPQIVERLRGASVSHVVSIEPIVHPDLEEVESRAPGRIAPLRTHLYRLRGAAPRVELGGPGELGAFEEGHDRMRFAVTLHGPAEVALREACHPGFAAFVDGHRSAPGPERAGRCGLAVPSGPHRVELRYHPPRLGPGLLLSLASAAACLGLRFLRV
jgi:hypothetical protein